MIQKIAEGIYSVPPNRFGIFVQHVHDDIPLNESELDKIINGPIAAMEDDLQAELAKVESY